MSTTVRAPSRAVALRRRRRVRLVLVLAAAAAGVVIALPSLQGAIRRLTLPLEHADIIRQQAAQKHIDPALIAAVIYAETKFDARTSPAGAEGLMQILPATALFLARRSGATSFTTADLATPQVNIAYGTYYLRYLLDEYHGDRTLALAAYNGGEANVDRWVAVAHAAGQPFTLAAIAFPETRSYVAKVESAERRYRADYASELGL
ncbi:MAG TPA: lytic transglycosylase domain-containing protein [Solirubrobacteraceae bacterium]|jgi:soluble lytic murein transglycosylase|nr:lytic transglycosylase domain-containing protein [Solirubrobacteraceae bacterium]